MRLPSSPVCVLSVLVLSALLRAQDLLKPSEADFAVHNFRFRSGEVLPELKPHHPPFGKPVADSTGRVTNAVMVLHGTTGSGQQFTGARFAGALFGPGHL